MEKRTAQEKEKYQPSYDTTILSEVSVMEPGKTNAALVFSNLFSWQMAPGWLRFSGITVKALGLFGHFYLTVSTS